MAIASAGVFLEAYGHWLRDFLNHEISRVSHTQRAMFCEPLAKVRQHLERTLRAFQDRLAEHVKTALGLSLTPHEFNLEMSEPSAPPVAVGVAFDVPLDLLGYLIPMALARPWVERRLSRRAGYEVEKNLSRLAADWRHRVSVAIEELRTQTEQYAGKNWPRWNKCSRKPTPTNCNCARPSGNLNPSGRRLRLRDWRLQKNGSEGRPSSAVALLRRVEAPRVPNRMAIHLRPGIFPFIRPGIPKVGDDVRSL